MRLHARERRKLHQIEEALRKDAPGLDTLLAGRPPPRQPPPRRPVPGTRAACAMAAYLVPPALLVAGLVLHVTGLVVAGAVLCPFIPVIAWLLIGRRLVRGVPGHRRRP